MTALPVGTVLPGAGGFGHRVRLGNPRRWVVADVLNPGLSNELVVAWDCDPRPAKHQPCRIVRQWWGHTADGRTLRIVKAVELEPIPDRALPVATGPTSRNDDPDTSKAAGASVNAVKGQHLALLAHAQHPDGLTDFELADLTHVPQTSIGKRRGELMRAGLVERTTIRRPSPSGALAGVYRINPIGLVSAELLTLQLDPSPPISVRSS